MPKNSLFFLIFSFVFLVSFSFLFLNQKNLSKKLTDFESKKAELAEIGNQEIERIKKEIFDLREEIIKMKNKNHSETEKVAGVETFKEPKKEKEKWCQKTESQNPKREVIFNEICWMGNEESSFNEWIELKNLSGKDLDLTGWQLKNKDETIKIILEGKIKKDGFFILERGEDALPEIESDFIFRGAIKNEDEALFLFDENCNLQDEVFANPKWPAGDRETKRTMERKSDFTWQTSENPGGTPKSENSQGFSETREIKSEPKITLDYPSEVFGGKEFLVLLSVSNLEEKTYDVKISVESENQILSEILDQKENSWQSSNYYLKEIFIGPSFSGNFRLKIKTKDFIGEAKIIAKIRDSKSPSKIPIQFSDKIRINQEEILSQTPSTQLSEKPLPEPEIFFYYPNEVSVTNEDGFEVNISLSYLSYSSYDLKISVQNEEGKDLTRICYYSSNESCLNSSDFKSSYYYFTNIFTGSSFSGKFKLIFDKDKVKTIQLPLEGKIITKVRKNGTNTSLLEYSNKILLSQ